MQNRKCRLRSQYLQILRAAVRICQTLIERATKIPASSPDPHCAEQSTPNIQTAQRPPFTQQHAPAHPAKRPTPGLPRCKEAVCARAGRTPIHRHAQFANRRAGNTRRRRRRGAGRGGGGCARQASDDDASVSRRF